MITTKVGAPLAETLGHHVVDGADKETREKLESPIAVAISINDRKIIASELWR